MRKLPLDFEAAIANLSEAQEFLDKCRLDIENAQATGALRDAREWVASAVGEVVTRYRAAVRAAAAKAPAPDPQ
jgi:hypothetical protein